MSLYSCEANYLETANENMVGGNISQSRYNIHDTGMVRVGVWSK